MGSPKDDAVTRELAELKAKLTNRNDLQEQLDELTAKFYSRSKAIDKKLEELTSSLTPLTSILDDIAAVGRAGKVLKNVAGGLAVVLGAFVVFYEYIEHFFKLDN